MLFEKKNKREKKKKEKIDCSELLEFESADAPMNVEEDVLTIQLFCDEMKKIVLDTAMVTDIGTRAYQQDAAYVVEPLKDKGEAFAILCDGMGGMESGELASSDVVAFMANEYASSEMQLDIGMYLEQAAHRVNEMIYDRYVKNGMRVGTTLVSAYIQNNQLYWLSVGDSRIYIIRDGEIARLARDHNYALELQIMVENGRITAEEAKNHPKKEALVSYIGIDYLNYIDVSKRPLELLPNDTILLCSDGLTKSLSDERILDILIAQGQSLNEDAQRLIATAIDESTGSQDNTTVVLMRYFGT